MRPVIRSVVLIAALLAARPAACQTDKSIVDLHGQDGIAFSPDDPLRVSAAVHNGVFYLSHNGVKGVNGAGTNPAGPFDFPEIGFFNMKDMTISRAKINMSTLALEAWEAPLDVGEGTTPGCWSADEDCYVSGNALEHDLAARTAGDKAHPALFVKPEWMPAEGPMKSMIESFVKEVRIERLVFPKCHIVGVMRLSDSKEALVGSLRVVFSKMWIYLKGLAALFMGSPMEFSGGAGAPGGGTPAPPPELDAETKALVDNRIQAAGLTGKVTADQIATASRKTNPTCPQIAPGLTPEECTAALGLVSGVSSEVGDTSLLANTGSFIQELIDTKTNYQAGTPEIYGWAKWRDPTDPDAPGGKMIAAIMQSKMKDRIKEFLNCANPDGTAPGELPVRSAGYMFNSLYLYSPPELYLLDCSDGPGLVENFAYARLNKIDPFDPTAAANGTASWSMVDLVTLKKFPYRPPPVKWPPQPAGAADTFAGGTCQLVGDEAATGTDQAFSGGVPPPPLKYSHMLMAVNPTENGLNVALKLRALGSVSPAAAGAESPWVLVKNTPLPPNYAAAGSGVGVFRVGIGNLRYGAQRGFQFGWDFDGDGTFDCVYGNTTRQLDAGLSARAAGAGTFVSCYVVDAESGATGSGIAKLKR